MENDKVFFFKINTQFGNIGDALINKELVNVLSEHGKLRIDLSSCTDEFRSWLEPIPKWSETRFRFLLTILSMWYLRVKGNDVWFVLNPGGNVGEISLITYLKRLVKSCFMFSMRKAGVKFIQVGVSYENLGSRHLKVQRLLAKNIDLHLVRDSLTESYCRRSGIRVDGRLRDLAFALQPMDVAVKSSRIVFSMRKKATGGVHDISKIISGVSPEDVIFSWQVSYDKPVAEAMRDEFSPRSNVRSCDYSIDDNRLFYGGSRVTITNRLHVFLLSLSAGGLGILLIEDNNSFKIRGILNDMGLSELMMEPEKIAAILFDSEAMENLRKKAEDAYLANHRMFLSEVDRVFGDL